MNFLDTDLDTSDGMVVAAELAALEGSEVSRPEDAFQPAREHLRVILRNTKVKFIDCLIEVVLASSLKVSQGPRGPDSRVPSSK